MHPKVQRLLFCKISDFQYSAEEETIDTHAQMWCLFTRWYDDDPSIFFWTSTCIDYFPTPPPPHIYSQTQIGDRPPWPLHFSLQYVGTSTKSSINFFAWILKRKTLLSKRVGPSFRDEVMASLLQLRLYHVGFVICMPKYILGLAIFLR